MRLRELTDPGLNIENLIERVIAPGAFGDLVELVRVDHTTAHRTSLPRLLICAPMSGHFPSLLRSTVRELSTNHRVYLTKWHDARTVPTFEGEFGLDGYVDYIEDWIDVLIGDLNDLHVMAVCQPGVPLLAALELRRRKGLRLPSSVVILGAPVNTRINPTPGNRLARLVPPWMTRLTYERRVLSPNVGVGRRVMGGQDLLKFFMSDNWRSHTDALSLIELDDVASLGSLSKSEAFYRDYLATMDIDADFFFDTLDQVFVRNTMGKDKFEYRGKILSLSELNLNLLTIEGVRDTIVGRGQCHTAHGLMRTQGKAMDFDTGHYGLFSGSTWRNKIAPSVSEFIKES